MELLLSAKSDKYLDLKIITHIKAQESIIKNVVSIEAHVKETKGQIRKSKGRENRSLEVFFFSFRMIAVTKSPKVH